MSNSCVVDEFKRDVEEWLTKPLRALVNRDQPFLVFILVTCATDWLAGFWKGTHNGDQTTRYDYIAFMKKYMPPYSEHAESLWKDLRCGLVHSFTIKNGGFVLMNGCPSEHLQARGGKVVLNLENFFQDWCRAKDAYLEDVEQCTDLQNKLCRKMNTLGFPKIQEIEVVDTEKRKIYYATSSQEINVSTICGTNDNDLHNNSGPAA